MNQHFWLSIFSVFFLLSGPWSWAEGVTGRAPSARGKIVGKISVKGNRKIEEDAVRNKLTTKAGEQFSAKKVREDVQALFEMGYFYNIVVDRSDSGGKVNLTYTFTEKPTITEVTFVGNDEIDDEDLHESAGIKAYEILDMARIRSSLDKLEKLYEEKGYFLAQVKHQITPIGKGETVKLTFNIHENDMVKVKKIRFLGNRQLTSGKLKSLMATKEGGFFSFMSGSGAYRQDAFDRDVQMLSYMYFNEGFVQVKVDRPEVYVTPDKKSIYITVRVQEGDKFDVGNVDFSGDLLFTVDELFEETEIEESNQFSYDRLQKDLRNLQAKYGDLGYAYANIIPRTRIREKDKLVDITFEIDKGNKVYIGDITVVGNTKTRDKVVRREIRVREGELYNETRKRESVENVRRLGYFEEVTFNTKTPADQPDVMDIDIVIKERNTGTIQVGAGYSSFQGFVLNGQVNQINLFGRGQKLGASLDLSKVQSLFNLSFTEPYFMDTEWETGFDLYQRRRVLSDYREVKRGGALRIGHPLAPYLRGIVSYRLDDTTLELDAEDGDEDLFPVDTVNGITSSMTFSLIYDKRNDRFAPTKGVFSSLALEYAGLGGDRFYTKGNAIFRYYKKLFWELVWRNNINYGFISSNKPGQDVPFDELFLLGGANTLRGYRWFTVGKRKRSQNAYDAAIGQGEVGTRADELAMRPFGGMQQFFYQLELQFPLIAEAGINGVLFYDIGNADDSLILSEFRSDVGFGFRWFSPIGPLRFEWGFPINRQDKYDEEPVNFQFAIGSPF